MLSAVSLLHHHVNLDAVDYFRDVSRSTPGYITLYTY